MRKQFIIKLLSIILILWISYPNLAHSEAIISTNEKLLDHAKSGISTQVLRKNCILYHGKEGVLNCQKLVKYIPLDPESWNNLGAKYYDLQEYKEALFAYKKAVGLNSKYSLAWANICGVLSQVQLYDLALQSCDRALQNDSFWGSDGKALAWDNKGNVLFYLGRYEQSLAAFDRALAINPNYHNASINRSVVLHHLKNFDVQESSFLARQKLNNL